MSSATFPFYVSPKPGEVAKEPMEPLAIETAPRHGLDSPDRYYADPNLQLVGTHRATSWPAAAPHR